MFIAANSRLDLQFEVIQADWINKGEILGQAGLNRCPLTGANLGKPTDSFLESGAVTPVTGLPPFVITRGGDYFFAPGVKAMREIAHGGNFAVPAEKLPYAGYSMGDATTPMLLSDERMKAVVGQILGGARDVVHIELLDNSFRSWCRAGRIVARVAHVKQALGMRTDANNDMMTSVAHYQEAVRTISTGNDMIVSTEPTASPA